MTQESCKSAVQPGLTETQVAAWLLEHPEFFVHNGWLLEHLVVPHQCGGAVSLIERQVALLRQTNQDLCRQMENLVHIARMNDALLANIHHLTLALLEAQSLSEAVSLVEEVLERRFQIEWVALRFFSDNSLPPGSQLLLPEGEIASFLQLFSAGEPYVGVPQKRQKALLFPDGSVIRSWALVPVGHHRSIGVLALGSGDKERFWPGLGKVFLQRLGELIGARLESLMTITAYGVASGD